MNKTITNIDNNLILLPILLFIQNILFNLCVPFNAENTAIKSFAASETNKRHRRIQYAPEQSGVYLTENPGSQSVDRIGRFAGALSLSFIRPPDQYHNTAAFATAPYSIFLTFKWDTYFYLPCYICKRHYPTYTTLPKIRRRPPPLHLWHFCWNPGFRKHPGIFYFRALQYTALGNIVLLDILFKYSNLLRGY